MERPSVLLDSRASKSLYDSRTILLCGEINQSTARAVTQQLLAMNHESRDDILLIINSQGGHVESGDTIHDMLQFVDCKVTLLGTGYVASAGALIFVGVPIEQRFCLPNTRFLLHQPAGAAGGQAKDVKIQAEEILKMRERLNRIIAGATGQPLERVTQDADRDFWLTTDEAIEYGLVSRVVRTRAEIQ